MVNRGRLIITRKLDDYIQIGDDITITIHYLTRGKVQLKIEAPRSINIWRGEIWDAKQEELRRQFNKVKVNHDQARRVE